MGTLHHLQRLFVQRLGGDRSRIGELFRDETILRQLEQFDEETDWYHFRPASFDGCYLVRGPAGYEVYEQDRGSKTHLRAFNRLEMAAAHFFHSYW